jgi:hypothetical protein
MTRTGPITDAYGRDGDLDGVESRNAARRASVARMVFCAYMGTLLFLLGPYWWLEHPDIANAVLAAAALLEVAIGFAIWLFRFLDDDLD